MNLLPLALVAGFGGLLYGLYYTKPRFLGDRLRDRDEAAVALAGLPSPEAQALAAIAPGASRLRVSVTKVDKDTFQGSIVGFLVALPNGTETSANLPPGTVRTFPKSAVTGISRAGKAVTL